MKNLKSYKLFEGKQVKRVDFNGFSCYITFGEYNNGRIAIELMDFEDGSPVAVATVNIPEYKLPEGHVIIKDYSENEGMLDALIAAGIVSKPVNFVSSGHIEAPVVKLLVDPKDYEMSESNQYVTSEEVSGYMDAVVLIMDTGKERNSIAERMSWIKQMATENQCEIIAVDSPYVVVAPKDDAGKNALSKFKKAMEL